MARAFSVAKIKEILLEAMPLLIFYSIVEIPAGGVFSRISEEITNLPGLLMLLPAIMGMRGNISGSYGARLGAAYHLGLITPETGFNDEAVENIKASLILTLITSVTSAVLAFVLLLFLGLPHMSFMHFLLISVGVSFVSGIIMMSFSYFVAMTAAKMGRDPNNITVPAIATVGDIVTLSAALVVAKVVALALGGG